MSPPPDPARELELAAAVLDAVDDAVFVHDPADGRILHVNRAACELYGWTRDEMLCLRIQDLSQGRPPYSQAEAREWVRRARREGPQRFEWLARDRRGRLFWVEVALRRACVAGAERVIASVRDIQRRKDAERRQSELERELLNSRVLEAVGRLAAGVAHDFNNVLGSVLGCAYVAGLDARCPPGVRDQLERIRELCQRGGELTRRLLRVARTGTAGVGAVDVAACLGDLRTLLERTFPRAIRLEVSVDEGTGAVRADPGQLTGVLLHLALNARDAMPEGGRLTIRARPAGREGVPGVRIEVTDTGPGVPDAIRDRIFEPYFTTKHRDNRPGMGLALARASVDRWGGRLELVSGAGPGSTFVLWLPCAGRPECPPADREAGERIVLVVQGVGERTDRVRAALERAGYRVESAATCVEALERLGRGAPVGAVVLGEEGARTRGPDVERLIGALAPEVPVVRIGRGEDTDPAEVVRALEDARQGENGP